MKNLKALALLGGLALIVSASPVLAVCANARLLTSFSSPSEYSYIFTPGVCDGGYPCPGDGVGGSSSTTANLKGLFWVIGDGDTTLAVGNDNGAFPAIEGSGGSFYYGWVKNYALYPSIMDSTWAADPRIDGCPDAAVPAGNLCTAVVLADEFNSTGYYAVLTAAADSGANYRFNLPGNAPINLAPIPAPQVTASNRLSDSQVELTIAALGAPSDGFYLDPACNDTVAGVRIRAAVLPDGSPAPDSRNPDDFQDLTGAVSPGSDSNVVVNCTGNSDIYLTTQVVFDSGFETSVTSGNSTQIECGPNFTDIQQRPRLRPGTTLDRPVRGGKQGRR